MANPYQVVVAAQKRAAITRIVSASGDRPIPAYEIAKDPEVMGFEFTNTQFASFLESMKLGKIIKSVKIIGDPKARVGFVMFSEKVANEKAPKVAKSAKNPKAPIDIRDIDYLAVLNLVGEKDPSHIRDWIKAFERTKNKSDLKIAINKKTGRVRIEHSGLMFETSADDNFNLELAGFKIEISSFTN